MLRRERKQQTPAGVNCLKVQNALRKDNKLHRKLNTVSDMLTALKSEDDDSLLAVQVDPYMVVGNNDEDVAATVVKEEPMPGTSSGSNVVKAKSYKYDPNLGDKYFDKYRIRPKSPIRPLGTLKNRVNQRAALISAMRSVIKQEEQ